MIWYTKFAHVCPIDFVNIRNSTNTLWAAKYKIKLSWLNHQSKKFIIIAFQTNFKQLKVHNHLKLTTSTFENSELARLTFFFELRISYFVYEFNGAGICKFGGSYGSICQVRHRTESLEVRDFESPIFWYAI